MKKILSVLLIAFSSASFAQKAAKTAYAELGGAGLASINYDMRLMKRNDGLGFRVGVGGFSVRSTYYDGSDTYSDRVGVLTVPVGINYLLGKDNKHYFEVGGGATYVSLSSKSSDPYYDDEEDKFNSSFGYLYFGYRIQPADGGFVFRAGITPVFGNGYFIPYWAGISFGYKF